MPTERNGRRDRTEQFDRDFDDWRQNHFSDEDGHSGSRRSGGSASSTTSRSAKSGSDKSDYS
jgi:hypothetical protein